MRTNGFVGLTVAAMVLVVLSGCISLRHRASEASEAIQAEEPEAASAILAKHPEIALVTWEGGYTLLHGALAYGQSELAAQLLDAGADPLTPESTGRTPLHWASARWAEVAPKIVDRLLAAGADPNAQEEEGATPLHWAGPVPIVERLLAAGANPRIKDRKGNTPLVYAAGAGDRGGVERLLAEGADAVSLDRALLAAGLGEYDVKRQRQWLLEEAQPEADRKKALEMRLAAYAALAERLRAERARVGGPSGVWRGASGRMPTRMMHGLETDEGYPIYQALWEKGEGTHLVCLKYPGGEGFGTPYDVLVFDEDMRLVRCGEITAQQDCLPYGLVEARSMSKSLPEGLRGQWLLAIATWWPERTFHEDRPIGIDNVEVPEDANFNELWTVPVQWWDPDEAGVRDFRAFGEPREVRWAEPGPSPLWRAE